MRWGGVGWGLLPGRSWWDTDLAQGESQLCVEALDPATPEVCAEGGR